MGSNNWAQTHDRLYVKFGPKILLVFSILRPIFNSLLLKFKVNKHDPQPNTKSKECRHKFPFNLHALSFDNLTHKAQSIED